MTLANVLFFAVFLSMWVGLHAWVAKRLIDQGSSYPAWARRTIWTVMLSLACVPLIGFFGRRLRFFGPDLDIVQWIGFSLLGLSTLLISFTMFVDIPRLIFQLGAWARARVRAREDAEDDGKDDPLISPRRRQFFADIANYGIVGGAAGLSVVGFNEARRVPRVVEVEVSIAALHPDLDGLKIVQLSDVHIGPTIRGSWLSQVVEVVNGLDADLVALTGDFVDGLVSELSTEIAPLTRIRSRHGAFFVTGNHEYYWDAASWCEHIATLGPTVLINEHRVIERGAARLLVAGVTDFGAGTRVPGHVSDPLRAKAQAPAHDLSLLLAHQPRSIYAAAQAGFDLQLSGHTHAGQYFPGNLLIHLLQPYVSGLATHPGSHTQIYVSRGTGYWGPPNRAGSPSEITLLTLRRAS